MSAKLISRHELYNQNYLNPKTQSFGHTQISNRVWTPVLKKLSGIPALVLL